VLAEPPDDLRLPVTTPATVTPIKPASLNVACSRCSLRELCLPVGISEQEFLRLDTLVTARRSVRRGGTLFRSGDRFEALYAIRTGFFKTRVPSPSRRDQVTGFQMAGELLGLDGIGSNRHRCDAIALEASQVCVIRYAELENLTHEFTDLQRHFHKLMSREIARAHDVMLLLGSMRAEQRLAAFLLNLAQRLQSRGYSPSSLVLRMTREEIGTYLGLKLETVSRCFSKFREDGVLQVQQRQIRILDPAVLQQLVDAAGPDLPLRGVAQEDEIDASHGGPGGADI
jgi:CRP/FNR family transcriptional regulator, anaerobic regulatory protein